MSDPGVPTSENAEGGQACPSPGGAGKVLICVRATCSELGEKMGNGLDNPYDDFRRKVAEIVAAGPGALIVDRNHELICAFESAAAAFRCTQSIQRAVAESLPVIHPFEDDLSFLYGTIFTGGALEDGAHSRNVCIFAEGEVDRSPTGTGVSARAAIHHARGELGLGEPITIESWAQTFYAAPMDFGGGVPGHQPRKTGAPDLHPDTHGH